MASWVKMGIATPFTASKDRFTLQGHSYRPTIPFGGMIGGCFTYPEDIQAG
jgi:hypothetical protein